MNIAFYVRSCYFVLLVTGQLAISVLADEPPMHRGGEGAGHAAGMRLATLFSAGTVLQRDMPVPVWGWAAPGEMVTVAFAGQSKTGKAGENGRWDILLDPIPASATPRPLTVTPSTINHQTLTVTNVLVGDVWLCSGQSNMQFPVSKAANAAAEIAATDFPSLRMLTVKPVVAGAPRADVEGSWRVCSPKSVGEFSAVAYFFGREIARTQKVPVGLIHASMGWTPSEAWTPREALRGNADTAYIAERWDWVGDTSVQAAGTALREEWTRQNQKLKALGKAPLSPLKGPGDPNFAHRASGLWNGAVAPLVPCALRGIIWYQGETNERRGYRYRIEFPLLIESWRSAWRRPELPFIFVQVANVLPPVPAPAESEWAELRESQALALKLPHTGMAVTIDIGEEKDVHPKNKQDVGLRLALQARALVYGEKIPHNSPAFASLKLEGGRIRLHFTDSYGKLKTKDAAPPKGFAISGADRRYVYAQAEIDGEDVIVWSDEVKEPVAVRYAWANNPAGCNLCNAAALPAIPFRTDDWPAKTQDAKGLVIDDLWK